MRVLSFRLQNLSSRRRWQFVALLLSPLVTVFAETAKVDAVLPVIAIAAKPARVPVGSLPRSLQILGGNEPLQSATPLLAPAAFLVGPGRPALVWLAQRQ